MAPFGYLVSLIGGTGNHKKTITTRKTRILIQTFLGRTLKTKTSLGKVPPMSQPFTSYLEASPKRSANWEGGAFQS
ncbi:hypothetical protein BIW11_03102 [Tropilaelaps mercedesae]|uniref:Uncharacterized protein n=1 Tax=Tropilaelaps mercedesae TaxID=418985 RepID=A0A1V9XS92_9ACAR|nr:hypothetical protein BIW11_03102 [Tropilaelaps mercedesae]